MKHKPLLLLLIMLLMSYLIGSVIAYPLYQGLDDPDAHAFHKLARHATLFCGLVFSFLLLRVLNLHRENRFGFGQGFGVFSQQLLCGLAFGCLIMLLIEAVLLGLSVHVLDNSVSISLTFLLQLLLKGLITGLIVGFLEEILFRGTLYKAVETSYATITVILITAVIYAAVHFIKFPVLDAGQPVGWLTGPGLLPKAFKPLFSFTIWDSFLTLFLLGVLLAIFRARHASIAYCIGIHAGIVMMLKATRKLTNFNPQTNLEWLVNNTDRQLGLLACLVLGLCCGVCYRWLRSGQASSLNTPD